MGLTILDNNTLVVNTLTTTGQVLRPTVNGMHTQVMPGLTVNIHTVPDTKTIQLSFFHLLAHISVIAICTSKVPKCSSTSAEQHGQGVNVSRDNDVMQLYSNKGPSNNKTMG